MPTVDARARSRSLADLLAERTEANRSFFASEAERVARLCHRMAERFARGGRLVAFGRGPAARSDARHVAVEFVHPVIVGKRALPALGLADEGGDLVTQVELAVERDDIAIGFGVEEDDGEAATALASARARGCLTIAFAPSSAAEWVFDPPSDDPFLRQELAETLYHVLWELVHVFFEHRGLLEGRAVEPVHDTGASSFLYPFLAEQETDLEAVVADVRDSVLIKAEDVGALREQTLTDGADELLGAAATLRASFDSQGKLLCLGNGGSATDAMDAAADFRDPPSAHDGEPGSSWPARRALDLTEDPAILTAIANDIGVEAIFARQIIALGRDGDAVLTLSTSGNSVNVIAALAEARRRGLRTVAMVGYDGGRVAAERLADHVVVTRSEHLPRIQEAQASAYHVLRELVESAGAEGT
ncbi:MAG TPA: SIS domain-containing protein [Thermoleophilaceae bacterium]|nr:SIS domain-containing protein [Thermoleophilaceae bacterium]